MCFNVAVFTFQLCKSTSQNVVSGVQYLRSRLGVYKMDMFQICA